MKIENRMNVLKAMEKKGLIKFSDDTGKKVKHWTGPLVTAVYVSSGPFEFDFNGRKYGVRFFDGCFNPFVVCLDEEPKHKIDFV